jgi:hypothetical protein
MNSLEAEICELAARRHLPQASLERWLALDDAGRAAFLLAARSLKLRTGQLVGALELLEEIAARERTTAAQVLARQRLRGLLDGAGSAPQRAHAFVEELRAIRFPRLREHLGRIESAIAAMRLPRGLSVLLPRDLSSDELTIQLRASGPAQLGRLLDALVERRGDLARIAAMLGGDEV